MGKKNLAEVLIIAWDHAGNVDAVDAALLDFTAARKRAAAMAVEHCPDGGRAEVWLAEPHQCDSNEPAFTRYAEAGGLDGVEKWAHQPTLGDARYKLYYVRYYTKRLKRVKAVTELHRREVVAEAACWAARRMGKRTVAVYTPAYAAPTLSLIHI